MKAGKIGEIGEIVITRKLSDATSDSPKLDKEISEAFKKFINCEWGNISSLEKQLNDAAVIEKDSRILAAYKTSAGKVYIITDWDRSKTTILFADEY